MMTQTPAGPPAVAGLVAGQSSVRVWSLTSEERLRRQLRRASATADLATADRVVVLRADWVFDEPLVKGLVAKDSPCAMFTSDGSCVAIVVLRARAEEARALLAEGKAPDDLPRLLPEEVAGSYNRQLKKREPPFLLPLTAGNLDAIESRVFAGSYKGVTDFVTLYLWPRPARAVTKVCAAAGITPNVVTSLSLVLALAATWLFWYGHYGFGLLAAWVMTFLDTGCIPLSGGGRGWWAWPQAGWHCRRIPSRCR
jgi:hypothetical protein